MKSTIVVKPKIRELLIARAEAGYSALDLAKAAKVNYSTIHAMESGRNSVILPKTAKKLADALNKKLEDLFEMDIRKDVKSNG